MGFMKEREKETMEHRNLGMVCDYIPGQCSYCLHYFSLSCQTQHLVLA